MGPPCKFVGVTVSRIAFFHRHGPIDLRLDTKNDIIGTSVGVLLHMCICSPSKISRHISLGHFVWVILCNNYVPATQFEGLV